MTRKPGGFCRITAARATRRDALIGQIIAAARALVAEGLLRHPDLEFELGTLRHVSRKLEDADAFLARHAGGDIRLELVLLVRGIDRLDPPDPPPPPHPAAPAPPRSRARVAPGYLLGVPASACGGRGPGERPTPRPRPVRRSSAPPPPYDRSPGE